MKASKFLNLSGKKARSPLYLILGEEPYFVEKALDRIRSIWLGEETEGMIRLTGKTGQRVLEGATVFDELRTLSMFGTKKLVVVKKAAPFVFENDEALRRYIEAPNETAALVLAAHKLDGRRSITKALKKKAITVECEPLYDSPPPWKPWLPPHETQLCQWTLSQFRKKKHPVSPDVALAIIDRTGNDLFAISRAVESLTLGTDRARSIEPADVRRVVGRTRRDKTFDLLDPLFAGNLAKALDVLQNILAFGLVLPNDTVTHPSSIGTILLSQIRTRLDRIRIAVGALAERAGKQEIVRRTGMHKSFVDRLIGEAKRYRKADWKELWRLLVDVDRELKSNRLPPAIVLERLLIDLVRLSGHADSSDRALLRR